MSENEIPEDEVLEDVEPYEGTPDHDRPQFADSVVATPMQDDEAGDLQQRQVDALERGMPRDLVGLMGQMNGVNTWRETLDWFKSHRTKELIGFDPDNMCLKIQRTGRNIPARYLTARESMLATPAEHRITRVRDFRRGMVAYHADPNDSNPADHITGIIGRVKDFDPDSLHDVLVITNSVQADLLTVVRATYFEEHWGDDFKFAATWLNGYELDVPLGGEHASKLERFHESGPRYDLSLLKNSERTDVLRRLDQILTQVRRLPDSPKLVRVHEFKLQVKDDRILDLRILDEAVAAGRVGIVKQIRDEIRRLIHALPAK